MRTAHRSSRLLSAIALAGSAALTQAETAPPHHARTHSQVHPHRVVSSVVANRVPSSVSYVPSYFPSTYIACPHTALGINRSAQGRSLIGVPPLVDPAAGVIDRSAWSWRPMRLGIAPGFPVYASQIRSIEPPAVALDGATFLADEVVYRLRGFNTAPPGTPGAEAARIRLEVLLASAERIVVYPVGLDYEQRMLTDAVIGGTDLAVLLRGR